MSTLIGDRIARLRGEVGLNQRNAAEAAGLSQSTLNRVETGLREPTLGEVVGLAHALGCLTSTILGRGEVLDRLQTAARTEAGASDVDSSSVAERLGFLLDVDAQLRDAGIGIHHVG